MLKPRSLCRLIEVAVERVSEAIFLSSFLFKVGNIMCGNMEYQSFDDSEGTWSLSSVKLSLIYRLNLTFYLS